MTFVTIHYSFDPEVELYAFESREEAEEFIEADFRDEQKIQKENHPNIVFGPKTECNSEQGFACLEDADDGDVTEWQIATMKTHLLNPVIL